MKKKYTVVMLCILSFGLLASTSPKKLYSHSFNGNSGREVLSDSSVTNLPINVDSFNLVILPPSSGVQFYKEGIIFLSSAKNEEKMLPSHVSFGSSQFYYAILLDTLVGEHTVFSTAANFSFPCEAVTFSADFGAMYFTKITKKETREKIYKAEYSLTSKGPGWVSASGPENFCTENSAGYSHPSLSSDDKMMIFASDMSGTFGGMDLYLTQMEDDKWSAPKNLGKVINSAGNEFFPFLDQENNLYFSSDGLPGIGGYDIFFSRYNGKDWDKPVNLSKLINSENDDVAFTLSKKDGRTAFFATKQKSDNKKMQLFRVSLNEKNAPKETTLSSVLYNLVLLESGFSLAETKPAVKVEAAAIVTPAPSKTTEVTEKPAKTAPSPQVNNEKAKAEPAKVVEPVKVVEPAKVALPAAVVVATAANENKNDVVYRIQFASSSTAKGSYSVTIGGKTYKTFEYLYKGSYRSTIGELKTLNEAKAFQAKCRASGYPQAFAVAFVNNERSTDPALFK